MEPMLVHGAPEATPAPGAIPAGPAPAPAPTLSAPPRSRLRLLWLVVVAAAVGLATYAGVAASYLRSLRTPTTIAGLRAAGQPVGGVAVAELPALLARLGEPALDAPVVVTIGPDRIRATRRELGLVVDVPAFVARVAGAGKSGNPLLDLAARRRALAGAEEVAVPFTLDRARALEALTDLKEWLDRAPVDAHLDLERHTVAAERPGHLLQAYEAMLPLDELARSGGARVELPTLLEAPRVKQADLAGVDISTVLASWETRYSNNSVESDRTYNLKVGAARLDGHILQPHELFSFNQVVGERTEKQGYRVAPVISGGELIDGLAGGMCQIASTLHAAAFFAGFDIVSATPHSRPSAYIPMGLDSTVVWPSTDLKIRNPFDFPVVMHYSVNQGAVRVELLGKRRVYTTVFEREIQSERPFASSTRRDPRWPTGQRYVAQEGYPGYHATRRRYLIDAGVALPRDLGKPDQPLGRLLVRKGITPARVDKWEVFYPSTEHILAVGAGPASRKKKDPPPSHRIPPLARDQVPFGRIVR